MAEWQSLVELGAKQKPVTRKNSNGYGEKLTWWPI